MAFLYPHYIIDYIEYARRLAEVVSSLRNTMIQRESNNSWLNVNMFLGPHPGPFAQNPTSWPQLEVFIVTDDYISYVLI